MRTYVDNRGERLFLTGGGLSDGRMVFQGTKRGRGNYLVHVRVSWIPVSADEVLQTWESSLDGETWKEHRSLRYTRDA